MVYGGFAALVVGMLTGSWAADLWQEAYLGKNNMLLRAANFFQVTSNRRLVVEVVVRGANSSALRLFPASVPAGAEAPPTRPVDERSARRMAR